MKLFVVAGVIAILGVLAFVGYKYINSGALEGKVTGGSAELSQKEPEKVLQDKLMQLDRVNKVEISVDKTSIFVHVNVDNNTFAMEELEGIITKESKTIFGDNSTINILISEG